MSKERDFGGFYGTMAEALAMARALEKQGRDDKARARDASTPFMANCLRESASHAASYARLLRQSIKQQRESYPEAKAEYEAAVAAADEASASRRSQLHCDGAEAD